MFYRHMYFNYFLRIRENIVLIVSYLGSSLGFFCLKTLKFLAFCVFCFLSQFLVSYQQFLSKIFWFPFGSFIELGSDLFGQNAQFQLAFYPSGNLS